jgi:hypothetical protein
MSYKTLLCLVDHPSPVGSGRGPEFVLKKSFAVAAAGRRHLTSTNVISKAPRYLQSPPAGYLGALLTVEISSRKMQAGKVQLTPCMARPTPKQIRNPEKDTARVYPTLYTNQSI